MVSGLTPLAPRQAKSLWPCSRGRMPLKMQQRASPAGSGAASASRVTGVRRLASVAWSFCRLSADTGAQPAIGRGVGAVRRRRMLPMPIRGVLFDVGGPLDTEVTRERLIDAHLRACDGLGVRPVECIMVGDRVDNDVVPAKLLGMRTVLFRTGRHRAQQPRSWDEKPDVEVHDVAGLERAIMGLVDLP